MQSAAVTVTMLSSLVLVLCMLTLLFILISLIFFLNKYDQEDGLLGGNWMKKVYRKSQSFVETLDDEAVKKSVYLRLKLVRVFLKVLLAALVGVVAAIVLWQLV
ncbi:MAG: hypothetical protein Crog4KO_15930 [Crocinitomicaceae bacterium]